MLAKLRGSILLCDATGVLGLLTLCKGNGDEVEEGLEGGALLSPMFLVLLNSNG